MKSIPEDLKTAVAQCFWIGLNGTTASDPGTREIFSAFQPGGVILFQRNVESIAQVRAMNEKLQALCGIPLFTAIDQEGGTVERLHRIIGTIPPAMALTAAGDVHLIREVHGAHARILRDLGFNVNFTPVLDLALSAADNGLGTRCFSDNPRTVASFAREVLRAHQDAGVLTSGKHFPGLGDTDLDSHVDLPTVPRSWQQMEREDLLPYRLLLKELPFIMINHALYPEKNGRFPASLAPEIVSGYLLDQLGYDGLSISDDLVMGAVSNVYSLSEAASRALLAGNHMFLICRPEGVLKAYRDLLAAALKDPRLKQAVHRNASRILAFKFQQLKQRPGKSTLARDKKILSAAAEKVSRKAITLLHGSRPKDLPKVCTAFLPHTKWISGARTALALELAKLGCRTREHFYEVKLGEQEGQELAAASNTEWNIVIITGLETRPGQSALLQRLLSLKKKVIVVHGYFPGGTLPRGTEMALATYWTAPPALAAVAAAISGTIKTTGVCPLKSGGKKK